MCYTRTTQHSTLHASCSSHFLCKVGFLLFQPLPALKTHKPRDSKIGHPRRLTQCLDHALWIRIVQERVVQKHINASLVTTKSCALQISLIKEYHHLGVYNPPPFLPARFVCRPAHTFAAGDIAPHKTVECSVMRVCMQQRFNNSASTTHLAEPALHHLFHHLRRLARLLRMLPQNGSLGCNMACNKSCTHTHNTSTHTQVHTHEYTHIAARTVQHRLWHVCFAQIRRPRSNRVHGQLVCEFRHCSRRAGREAFPIQCHRSGHASHPRRGAGVKVRAHDGAFQGNPPSKLYVFPHRAGEFNHGVIHAGVCCCEVICTSMCMCPPAACGIWV